MIKKLSLFTIVAYTLASCSTSKQLSQSHKRSVVVARERIDAELKVLTKQDDGRDGLVLPEREAGIEKKLEKEFQKCKGVRYRYGGTSFKGFDCSGFTQYVYKKAFDISLPRSTREMLKVGRKVSKSELRIGDLVFFKPSSNYRHVGIFMGDDQFMHVSRSKGVSISSLKESYWSRCYIQSRRMF